MKYWEIIADNLSKAGWSLGWVSALDREGRTIWIADAHRGDGKRFVVQLIHEFHGLCSVTHHFTFSTCGGFHVPSTTACCAQ
jgi:hypothetical protein